MTTYRAAYLASPATSNGAGFVLTLPEHAGLSAAELIAEARPSLAEYNDNAAAIGEAVATESDITIGDWTE